MLKESMVHPRVWPAYNWLTMPPAWFDDLDELLRDWDKLIKKLDEYARSFETHTPLLLDDARDLREVLDLVKPAVHTWTATGKAPAKVEHDALTDRLELIGAYVLNRHINLCVVHPYRV